MGLFRKSPKAGPADLPGSGFVHFDLVSADAKATRAFYEAVFGWTFRHVPVADYWLATAGRPPNGGLRNAEAGEAPHMTGYISVPSLDEAAARIKTAGGRVLGKRQKIPGYGAFLRFEAPGGLVQAIFEEA